MLEIERGFIRLPLWRTRFERVYGPAVIPVVGETMENMHE